MRPGKDVAISFQHPGPWVSTAERRRESSSDVQRRRGARRSKEVEEDVDGDEGVDRGGDGGAPDRRKAMGIRFGGVTCSAAERRRRIDIFDRVRWLTRYPVDRPPLSRSGSYLDCQVWYTSVLNSSFRPKWAIVDL